MNNIQQHAFLLNNVVVWAIFIITFICYGLLIEFCFVCERNRDWQQRAQFWAISIARMLAALPLLGLLGTIGGLLKTFQRMSVGKGLALQELISGGIAEALFTTQLGLFMVVPGLLMLSYLNYLIKNRVVQRLYEVNN